MAQLSCQNLCLGYDGKEILRDLNFEVGPGDYLCIVGENGSGNGLGNRPAPAHRTERENQRRRICRHDLGRLAGYRIPVDEFVFHFVQFVGGDVCATLFGSTSILTLTQWEVWVCAVLSVVVVAAFAFFYNKIFCVTFDEDFAKATGTKAGIYNLIISIIIAVIIVLAMNLVGLLLISALVIFPALSAMRIFKSFKSVTVCSAVLSVCCSLFGILISILAGTPVGSTIVAVDIAAFIIFSLAGTISGGIRK